MKILKIGLTAISVFLLAWPLYAATPAPLPVGEIEYFIQYFSDNAQPVPKAVYGELEFSGISDPKLFDVVERRFLEEFLRGTSKGRDHVAWLSKALSYSGQSKYRDTLSVAYKRTSNATLRKHIGESIERSPQFEVWNVEISRDTANLHGDALLRKRVLNMLHSSDSHLVMYGAKRVWFHYPTDSEFVRVASERLTESYSRPKPTTRDIDAIGWLCNVLGKSGNAQYKPLLDKISAETKIDRIRQYADSNSRDLK